MRRLALLLPLLLLGALASGAGAAVDPCAGIAGCTVAPAQPVAVAVGIGPVAYTVPCPTGTTAVTTSTTTQAGTYVMPARLQQGPLAFQDGNGTITWSGVPAVSAGASAAVTIISGSLGSPLVQSDAGGTVPGGAGAGPTPTESGVATLVSSGATFSAALPPFPGSWSEAPTASMSQWTLQWELYSAVPIGGAQIVTSASFSPQVGCAPQARGRAVTASTHRVVTRAVQHGRQEHRIWCPPGTRRNGPIGHAVFVEGRSRLTVAERGAIVSRHVADGAGRAHIETRIGRDAPAGLRIQLHADCMPGT